MNDEKRQTHCVALFSGGLDSALAVLLMLKQNIKVTALTCMTHFGCDLSDRSSCGFDPYPAAEKYGFDVKLLHLGQEFIDMVKNPRFGRGKHMNPCIDCRILMLKHARELMEMIGADFIITGEVMGQRPMSQLKDKLNLTLRESGLKGRLLRPLSARLLPPTIAEEAGLVDRDKLERISGRGRARQMELARELGLEDYPSPASGCLLTDGPYSGRLKDLLDHIDDPDFNDLNMLQCGRHFRLDDKTRIIVGRTETDNSKVMAHKQPHHVCLEVVEVGSPVTLLIGDASAANMEMAARITARYSAAKRDLEVKVAILSDPSADLLTVTPATLDEIDKVRVPDC